MEEEVFSKAVIIQKSEGTKIEGSKVSGVINKS